LALGAGEVASTIIASFLSGFAEVGLIFFIFIFYFLFYLLPMQTFQIWGCQLHHRSSRPRSCSSTSAAAGVWAPILGQFIAFVQVGAGHTGKPGALVCILCLV
jgi:hypothetical protein